jgi:GH43 family beta-xylosidase
MAGRACRPRNPVWVGYFADPFVLRHDGTYYAYGTSRAGEGTVPALRSPDLCRWEPLGDVLEPLSGGDALDYWAPEVAHRDGTWWMYYSAGGPDGEGHRLRVARGEAPAGPFSDTGILLDPEDPFSIDAHPFQDADGAWYLFYARDFLTGDRVGTGIVVDGLPAPDRLGGDPRVVVRPHEDWQLYEAARTMYGRVFDWHTVEGPFVVRRGSVYHCLYSGGRWSAEGYGVHHATASHPLGPWHVAAPAGPAAAPAVLATRPGRVIGPGHACVVSTDAGDWLVYHAWDPALSARTMRIDALRWTAAGPRCDGPTLSSNA